MIAERYLALVGDASQDAHFRALVGSAARVVRGVERHDFGDNLTVFAAPCLAVTRTAFHLVIGQIHDRTSDKLADRHGPEDLARTSWGNYIAFGLDPNVGQISWILRAPLGHLPAFRATVGTTALFASDAALLLEMIGGQARIDWTFVAEHLACQHLQTARTGLSGIDELLGGECLRRGAEGNWDRTALWLPWTFTAAEQEIGRAQDAERALRDSVDHAVARLTRAAGACLLVVGI